VIALAAQPACAGTIDTTGQEPYERCGYCHELDGNPRMEEFPRLAGQSSDYLAKQLRDFRAGRRSGTMQATAELLSDDDIAAVARYFNEQAPRAAHRTESPPPADRRAAERLHREGDGARGIPACRGCHGPDGAGSSSGPRLAMQHAAYLEAQLLAFKRGRRTNDAGGTMRAIASAATEPEIRALSLFFAGLGGQ
jgi:cytochrome c553